jgi:hypothetical protein
MKRSISVNKKSRGRPKKKGGVYPVTAVRLPPELGGAVDKWAALQDDTPTRSEAIRRLVEVGLTVKARSKQSPRVRAEAAKAMASDQLDQLVDRSASAEQQANRTRRLLKGPEEFQSVRVDRSISKK